MDNIDNEELSFNNIDSVINFIKNNWVQLLLLILVFIIIYVVDYISNINAIIFAIPSPIPSIQHVKENINKIKKGKKIKV
jgi:hypothetical protein